MKIKTLLKIATIVTFCNIKIINAYGQMFPVSFSHTQTPQNPTNYTSYFPTLKDKIETTSNGTNSFPVSPKLSEKEATSNFFVEQQNRKNSYSKKQELLSPIEEDFAARSKSLKTYLQQFGYSFFKGFKKPTTSIPVDKTYVLGPGDELFIYVIGNPPNIDLSQISKLVVDREGKVYIPGLGVFYVWGKTLGQAEKEISKALGVNIKLTVGRLRTFPVYVSGEVNRPGATIVTGTNTVIDAIMMAGGIKGTGSLRNVIIRRQTPKGLKTIKIDFYKLLLNGMPVDIRLKDGDVIFIPPVKKVAGIGGAVKRPAIYELKGSETLKDLIDMAGGILPSAYKYKVTIQRYVDNTVTKVIEGSLSDKNFISQKVHSGDLVIIKKMITVPQNAVLVKGYVAYPGVYAYKPGMKLSQILTPDMFLIDTNMKFGLIIRQFPHGTPPQYITFIPENVLNGKENVALKPQDTIVFYKFGETKKVDFNKVKDAFVVEGEIKYPGVYAYKPGMKLSQILNKDMLTINTNLYYAEIDRRDLETLNIKEIIRFSPIDIINGTKDIDLQALDVVKFYPKYVYPPVKVSGLVENPHYIPYRDNLKLKTAIASVKLKGEIKNLKVEIFREAPKRKSAAAVEEAENIKVKAETGAEVIKRSVSTIYLYDLLIKNNPAANITLNPGDRIIIKEISPEEIVEKVNVAGYVKRPGVFKITEKTTLYDVLKAAGGFKEKAFPQGIIILRNSIKQMEKEHLAQAILQMRQELEKEQAGIMQSDLTKEELQARQSAFESKRKLLDLMEKTQVSGRITGLKVPEDLEKLKNSPYNILLEDGDQIIIPKIPSSVLVFGEVYNPGAIVYRKGLTVEDYLKMCGGLTKDADRENIFIIKADGTTVTSTEKKYSLITWSSKDRRFLWGSKESEILSYKLQPGDAVIVPTKINVPTMWRPLIKDVIQIIYQSALTVYTVTHI
ncbi:SLBB domain-containing protein [Desulfurobacterium atlanticum]|uniref:Polysaccharide export outer membrane protein n=1 Tax=Desulfurobacterium atlanticum TaxID=240169 RepID=A0A239A8W2_9BACT|nr:SLBB domain-containing protein [Desulfurobacterium atlanticum]SNR92065.1 polysaccharide export outer membrane protein [Desulfurobacterium atlanticum]